MGDASVVELSAGDVLVVPRHWWHYVENLTTAISINMWIPLVSYVRARCLLTVLTAVHSRLTGIGSIRLRRYWVTA